MKFWIWALFLLFYQGKILTLLFFNFIGLLWSWKLWNENALKIIKFDKKNSQFSPRPLSFQPHKKWNLLDQLEREHQKIRMKLISLSLKLCEIAYLFCNFFRFLKITRFFARLEFMKSVFRLDFFKQNNFKSITNFGSSSQNFTFYASPNFFNSAKLIN